MNGMLTATVSWRHGGAPFGSWLDFSQFFFYVELHAVVFSQRILEFCASLATFNLKRACDGVNFIGITDKAFLYHDWKDFER